MKTVFVCLLALGVFCGQGMTAQAIDEDAPMTSTGELQFFADAMCFQGPDKTTRLEIAVLVDARQFVFVPEKGTFLAQFDLTLRVVRDDRQVIRSENWMRHLSVANQADLREGQAPHRDRVWLDLAPGRYHVSVELDDMYGDKSGICQQWVQVPDFEGDALVVSDVICASEIISGKGDERFERASWTVVPNTTRRYLVEKPIPIYFELYHLATEVEKGFYVVAFSLIDTTDIPVKTYPPKRYLIPGKSAVQTTSLSTEGIKPGVYWVQIKVFDRVKKRLAQQRRRVVLASLGGPPPELSESEATQLRYYMDIRYVATPQELKQYKRLGDQAAQMTFLRSFWKRLDPTPDTPVNERLLQHMQRIVHVETHFSGNSTQRPADTDRGRIYITFGPPDDIQYNVSSSDDKPSEVWHYGRYEFIFRDPNGLGVYSLVHSTYPGEIYNPEWQMQTY